MILSIGLAIKMIGLYTIKLSKFTAELGVQQKKLEDAVRAKDDTAIKAYTEIIAMLNTLIGFYREWIQEWKDVIKDTRQLLKSLGDLARPAQ